MSQQFVLTPDDYRRDLNFVATYKRDAINYLIKMRNVTKEVASEFVNRLLSKGGELPLKNPRVLYLEQVSPGNRVKKTGTLLGYLKEVSERRLVMSPTMTAYTHPDEERSVTAMYITEGLHKRSVNKKEFLTYKAKNDKLKAGIYNNRQQRNKIKNNSMSGAHGTPSSVLFVKTAHSSLTSTCRSAAQSTNANLDRVLTGNRHYWSADIAVSNIMNTISNHDMEKVTKTMLKYGIEAPSKEFTKQVVLKSCAHYWKGEAKIKVVTDLIDSLTDMERAAYLFSGDLYSLSRTNPELVRDIFWHLSTLPDEGVTEDTDFISMLGEDEMALLLIVADPIVKSRNYWNDPTVKTDPEFPRMQAAAKRILTGLNKYFDLFSCFWLTGNVAASMAVFPSATREAVIASDTDSSIFTNQDWVEWYHGDLIGTQEAFATASASTYLCSKLTSHVLAVMSGSMGVADEHLEMLQMKNEYAFKFFGLTTMAKHYFASMDAQEGNVYLHPDWEIKGVTLRNSAAPPELVKESNALIEQIGKAIMNDEKLVLGDILQDVADKEHQILDSLRRGDPYYFKEVRINSADSYKVVNSVYLNHLLWNDAWSHRLGKAPDPTYQAMVIKTDIVNKTDWVNFLDSIEDQVVHDAIVSFCDKYGKKMMKTFYLPYDIIKSSGIPDELINVMNLRDMVRGLMKSFYLILETLGYFVLNKKNTKLVSDDIAPSAKLLESLALK